MTLTLLCMTWTGRCFDAVCLQETNLIPSSEFNAYLKQIKVILSAVKKYRILSLVTNTIYIFFTVANSGCSYNLGLNILQKRSGMHSSCPTLRYGTTHVK